MSRIAVSLFALACAAIASCGRAGDSTSAAACARVVQQVRDLPKPVAVVGSVETAEGQVEIDYEADAGDPPSGAGSATCTFAVGGPGSLQLVDAIVDGSPLGPDEIAGANRALSGGAN